MNGRRPRDNSSNFWFQRFYIGCWVSYGIKQEPVGGPSADDRMGRRPHLIAGVAQLVEQLICNQPVGGSDPSSSAICHR